MRSPFITLTLTLTIAISVSACDDEIDHDYIDPDHVTGKNIDAPREPDMCHDYPGSIGCPCPPDGCVENLVCKPPGFCGPCPAEQLGCECGPDGTCEPGLTCTPANTCE